MSFVWPCDDALARAQAVGKELVALAPAENVHALEERIAEVVRGEPIAEVLMALSMTLGDVGLRLFGPLTAEALAPVVIAVQAAWSVAQDNRPTQH